MVNATVDNEAISINLSPGESTTVPTGEVWKVTLSMSSYRYDDDPNNIVHNIQINGQIIVGDNGQDGSKSIQTVVTGDDTITFQSEFGSVEASDCHIGGFVVN